MKKVRIGMVGYGNVGKGLVLALQQKQDFLQKEYGINFLITAIFSPSQGCAYNPEGLSLSELVEGISLKELSNCEHPAWNAVSLIQQAEIDVIVEVSSTNLNSGEPAVMHLREAILSGKHIVTCNKATGSASLQIISSACQTKQCEGRSRGNRHERNASVASRNGSAESNRNQFCPRNSQRYMQFHPV